MAVTGLPLAEIERPVTWPRCAHLLADHGVLVLPGQDVDDAAFVAFLARFGDLAFTPGETPVAGLPDLNVISNVGRTTPPRSVFHIDTSYVRRPPAYTALRAVQRPGPRRPDLVHQPVPRVPTRCPPRLRDHLAGRTITPRGDRRGPRRDDETAAEHPVFRRHPISGRTALYICHAASAASAISGLTDAGGQRT